ncbi:MAG: phosphopentomutase [Mogibacterium sp.]|nr:phosphopentomutase [Mogibacterium sp.]
MSKRVFWIVLDSVGLGGAPDAADFGDAGADTLGSCYKSGGMNVPNMESLGLANIEGTSFRAPKENIVGCYCRIREKSMGKDTTVGHWEMAGMVSPRPLPTYPNGFPKDVLDKLEAAFGRKIICNLPYSGTEVIKDYGNEHVETGALIVYTSADSVLQIAAHEDVVPIEQLYEYCRQARDIMQGEHGVGRIIARPFEGEWPYQRTVRRHDFSLKPPRETVLDALKKEGFVNIGVGKIYDIFAGKSVMVSYPNKGNHANMERVLDVADSDFEGLCYVNLVDTDMIYGHRRDVPAYTKALCDVDVQIGQLMEKLRDDDILIVTADHGCDPGYTGTDHTREDIPCLVYGPRLKKGVDLGCLDCFADMGATIADYFGISYRGDGNSFLDAITTS